MYDILILISLKAVKKMQREHHEGRTEEDAVSDPAIPTPVCLLKWESLDDEMGYSTVIGQD